MTEIHCFKVWPRPFFRDFFVAGRSTRTFSALAHGQRPPADAAVRNHPQQTGSRFYGRASSTMLKGPSVALRT